MIRELLGDRSGRTMLVGDGVSDLVARPAVDLFAGFGGVVTRARVAAEADVYIKANSLAPILPLALSENEQARLVSTAHELVLNKGMTIIRAGEVSFRHNVLQDLFLRTTT